MFMDERMRPSVSQEHYNAIMALQPVDIDDYAALIPTDECVDIPPQSFLCNSVSRKNAILKKTKEEGIPSTDSYNLREIRASNLADYHKAIAALRWMIMSSCNGLSEEERETILTKFYMLQADNDFYMDFYAFKNGQKSETLPMFRIS